MKIGNLKINHNSEPLIIPEMGINHAGKLEIAFKIVKSAFKAGAKIIKNQTHIAEDEYSYEAKKIIPDNAKQNIFDLIKRCELTMEEEFKLKKYTESLGLEYLSTPFSRKAVDRLNKLKVKAFKIGSGECNNYPLIEYICKFRKPVILSTGMNNLNQIKVSTNILKKNKIEFAINHCTNIYPSDYHHARLKFIDVLKKSYPKTLIGLSDHSRNNLMAIIAMSKGVKLIERHYVDSKKRKGPDISSSMSFEDLKELIKVSKNIYTALQNKNKILNDEINVSKFAFASVVSTKDIKKGEKFSSKNLWVKRPGTGDFSAKDYKKLINKTSRKYIKINTQIKFSDLK